MKDLVRTSLLIALLMLATCIASCGVTETGNPKPGGESAPFSEPSSDETQTYINNAFDVMILYPAGWSFEESADETNVDFQSSDEGEEGTTTALITFEILDSTPMSLFAYLFETYPERSFSVYVTTRLVGYTYDNPDPGPNGGDLQEYFFLDNDLLLHVDAEVFPATAEQLRALLDGISFL